MSHVEAKLTLAESTELQSTTLLFASDDTIRSAIRAMLRCRIFANHITVYQSSSRQASNFRSLCLGVGRPLNPTLEPSSLILLLAVLALRPITAL